MKLWFASLTVALVLPSASAQLLSPESVQYSLLGAMVGGSVGGDYHCGHYHWSGENAAIGAGVGLLAGTLIGEARRQESYHAPYANPQMPGYGYAPNSSYAPAPASASSRPNYMIGGTLIGAASGALIGEGSSGDPGQGAAIGAAAGFVLGSLAEHQAGKREGAAASKAAVPGSSPALSPTPAPNPVQTQAPPAVQYQVPDAPRVPDAPTF